MELAIKISFITIFEKVQGTDAYEESKRRTKKRKTRYEKHIGLLEVFLEAVPTVFVMTVLLFKAASKMLWNSMTNY